jgi:hypothetical protein
LSNLRNDIDVFHRKIRFQAPVANGAQHLAPHVMTGQERLAIEHVVEAAQQIADININIDYAWVIWRSGPAPGQSQHNHVRDIIAAVLQ